MRKSGLIIGVICLSLVVAFIVFQRFSDTEEGAITFLDYPTQLTSAVDTIVVEYVNWACACPTWLPIEYLENANSEDYSEYCIFIESRDKSVKISNKYFNDAKQNKLKLIGKYYSDKGISRDYVKQTSQKPEKARVFQYSHVEILNN